MIWIPCDKTVPDDETMVLIYIPGDRTARVWIGYRDAEEWWTAAGDELSHPVTHWMPLPNGPEGT